MKDIDIFLIHGTFANDAEWINEQSFFCKRIKERISGNVTFHQYIWDGKNSFNSRYIEGTKLGKQIDSLEESDSTKIIIGHSHGGNVGLYSLGIGQKVDLIFTLGTPFIINQTKFSVNAIDNFVKLLCIFLLVLISDELYFLLTAGVDISIIIMFFLFVLALGGILLFFYQKGKKRILKIVRGFKKEIQYMKELDVSIVNIQYAFDEANFFLNLINNRIQPISTVVYFILSRLNNVLLIVIYFALFFLYSTIFPLSPEFILYGLILVSYLTIFTIIYFPISLIINALSFNRIALGSYPTLLTFFLKIKVSKHLKSIYSSATDYIIKPPKKAKVGLNHSMYYVDPNVANIIGKEINSFKNNEDNLK